MEITQEQLRLNQEGFAQIVSSGAFQTLESFYVDRFLQGATAGKSTSDMGESYLFESGVMQVFRMFRDLAVGGADSVLPEALEEESLEDDSNSLLD